MIGEFLGLFEVVGGEHDGGAVAGEIAHQFPAPPAGSGVESGGRLVEEENIGRADDAEREIDSSLLPTRKTGDAFVELVGKFDHLDDLVDAPATGIRRAVEIQGLANGEFLVDTGLLQHDADAVAERSTSLGGIDPEDGDPSAVATAMSLKDLDRGGLPSTVGPEDGEHLPGLDRKGHAIDGPKVAVGLGEILNLDRRGHGPDATRAAEDRCSVERIDAFTCAACPTTVPAMRHPVASFLAECSHLLGAVDEPMAQRFASLLAAAADTEGDPSELASPFPLGPHPDMSAIATARTAVALAGLVAADPHIGWRHPPEEHVPPGWAHSAAAAELLGPDGSITGPDSERFGLFFLNPGVTYPDHWHDADEFYFVLAGSAVWTVGDETTRSSAGSYIQTPSQAVHRIITDDEPVLTVWGWSGDTSFDSYGY